MRSRAGTPRKGLGTRAVRTLAGCRPRTDPGHAAASSRPPKNNHRTIGGHSTFTLWSDVTHVERRQHCLALERRAGSTLRISFSLYGLQDFARLSLSSFRRHASSRTRTMYSSEWPPANYRNRRRDCDSGIDLVRDVRRVPNGNR